MIWPIREGDIPGVQLRRDVIVGADLAEVWRSWSEAARARTWLGDEVELDGRAGGSLAIVSTLPGGEVLRELGTIADWRPPHGFVAGVRLAHRGWDGSTRLTVRLQEDAASTRVDVLQEGFHELPLSVCTTAWELCRVRWSSALDRLEALFAEPPGG